MLTSTFLHVQGVGPATERTLWRQGATHWRIFADNPGRWRIAPRHIPALRQTIGESLDCLEQGRVDYFAAHLPQAEHWRALSDFPKIGYLDIETDGGMDGSAITLIGLGDGCDATIYIKGKDLDRFAYDCQDYDGFVTFFGAGFDLPMLKRRFPVLERVFAERLHVDLCPLLKRLGYKGGLKSIERQLKINRVPETEGLSGLDAVRLWSIHRRGGADAEEALRLLVAYNREDVVNMKMLLDFAVPRITNKTGWPV